MVYPMKIAKMEIYSHIASVYVFTYLYDGIYYSADFPAQFLAGIIATVLRYY